jgi:hypothetical protein
MFVSSTPTTPSVDSMAQWGLDCGRAMMDSCKALAPSGAMVASMAGLVRGFTLI